ncbi:MAG: histidinol-phosphatase [Candidatus Thorarchaeota archaeon]|nr:histidinol-phosphatase [Candidatus Thorarchaeota archaeon]
MMDYHLHPNYSIDAEGSIESFCKMAIQGGLQEIAFTTHLDTDSSTDDCFVNVKGRRVSTRSNLWLEEYESEVRTADDTYKDQGLRVRLGVEVDYIPEMDGALPERFYATDFDLILGSTHLIDHIAISASDRAEHAFSRYTAPELGEKYYTLLLEAIETELFDILAHLDLYRRFGQIFYGEEIHEIWKPHLKTIVQAMKKHNVGFEINTSPLRRKQTQPMPEENIVRALKEFGITVVTIGSDAHSPADVGAGIHQASALLKRVGYTHIFHFEARKAIKRPIW